MAMKIAVITCYFDPDYPRARTIRSALKKYPGSKLIVVKNRYKGLLRYPEITWRLIRLRLKQNPDIYVLTFRGQEILPLVLALAGKKPVVFDEFIVPLAYATTEKHKRTPLILIRYGLARISAPFYRRWLSRCRAILADTQADAELSAKLSQVNLSRYHVLPVGTDEELFRPSGRRSLKTDQPLEVFYVGNMLPLHGLDIVLEAAVRLADKPINFRLAGGKKTVRALVANAQKKGAHIDYDSWINFNELPAVIEASDLCLAGPFGGTPQAMRVITGKTYQFLYFARPTLVGANLMTDKYFNDKLNCLKVEQNNIDELTRALSWAIDHRQALIKIGEAGRATYDKYFSSSVLAIKLKAILDQCV